MKPRFQEHPNVVDLLPSLMDKAERSIRTMWDKSSIGYPSGVEVLASTRSFLRDALDENKRVADDFIRQGVIWVDEEAYWTEDENDNPPTKHP